jgi:hypothetical protein
MLDTPPTTAADPTNPGTQSRSRVRYNAALKLVRRAHLFAGLFMTPWVFLYGITGFLFNHPGAFPDREVRYAGRSAAAGTALESFPGAPEIADQVVAALNAKAGTTAFRLVESDSAALTRPLLVNATGRGREHLVRFDPDSGESFIRSTPADLEPPSPVPTGTTVTLADPPRDRLARGVPSLLAKLGIESDTASLRNPPDLVCTVEHEGRRWRVAYNLQTGATTARPAGTGEGRLSTRRFLTGLHLAFTYPSRVDARWFWAVAVDAMFVSMVFWGVSGLLMWWQMKKLRRWGVFTLIVSAIAATALALGMHDVLSIRA